MSSFFCNLHIDVLLVNIDEYNCPYMTSPYKIAVKRIPVNSSFALN